MRITNLSLSPRAASETISGDGDLDEPALSGEEAVGNSVAIGDFEDSDLMIGVGW